MRTKRVLRYYCDFCRKAGMAKYWIAKHEKGCTANPGRFCGLCEIAEDHKKPQAPIADLMACLSHRDGRTSNVGRQLSSLHSRRDSPEETSVA
jgi:hypothetical protein